MAKSIQQIAHHPLRSLAFVALMAVLASAMFIGRATANLVPTNFQLDGDTHKTATVHDWSQVFDPGTFGANGADKALFLPDVFPFATNQEDASDDDQPATGATKDVYDMDQWNCKEAVLSPPKNDMADAFVASYTIDLGPNASPPGKHQIIYFGLDRVNSDNGTANVGFWFTKENHDCDGDAGTALWTGGPHSEGDVLVTSAFSGGGRVSTIKVFEWCSEPGDADYLDCGDDDQTVGSPGFGIDGPIQLLVEPAVADCQDIADLTVPEVCATVNRTQNTDGPEWGYDGAGTPSDTYERGALFEGGIDATGLGLDLVCAGTFVADTRSSTSPTAQLHDFRIGQVDLCSAILTTQASTNSNAVLPGATVSDTATMSASPASAPVPQGTIDFFLCQPNEVTPAGCPTGAGTKVGVTKTLVNGTVMSDTTTNTNTQGKYCWRAQYTPAATSPYTATSHTNATTECFRVFRPTTVISIRDQLVNLPSDASGSVTYEIHTNATCTALATNGVITPSLNAVSAGVAPPSNIYTPAAAGTFYIKASFSGTGAYAGVEFSSCDESAVLTF